MEVSPLQKVLQVTCPLHPSNQSEILHIAADAVNHRACIKCLLSGNVPTLAALDLKSLFQVAENEDKILSFYPPLSDSTIFQRLESIEAFSTSQLIEQIEQFISDLRRSVDEIIDKVKKDSIQQAEELGKQRRYILDLYKSLCEPNQLKEAVLQASDQRLHEIIVQKCKNSSNNTSKLESVISQFETNQRKFSMKQADESLENIRNSIQKISFFTCAINPLFPRSILQDFQIVPSNLFDSASRAVISRKENNQLDFQCIQFNKVKCIFYSQNVLDTNSYYCFRFTFHQNSKNRPVFTIGIINEKDKESIAHINGIFYKEHSQDCQINKVTKGVALNSESEARYVHKELEMRVNLSSRTVKVADFPNHNNIVELMSKVLIKEGCQYNLYIALSHPKDHITLTEVIVSDRFDSLM